MQKHKLTFLIPFSFQVLGRSTKLSSYCKNDSTEECWIEIELKGFPGRANLVVRRVLSRESNSSTFYLDGEAHNLSLLSEERKWSSFVGVVERYRWEF